MLMAYLRAFRRRLQEMILSLSSLVPHVLFACGLWFSFFWLSSEWVSFMVNPSSLLLLGNAYGSLWKHMGRDIGNLAMSWILAGHFNCSGRRCSCGCSLCVSTATATTARFLFLAWFRTMAFVSSFVAECLKQTPHLQLLVQEDSPWLTVGWGKKKMLYKLSLVTDCIAFHPRGNWDLQFVTL